MCSSDLKAHYHYVKKECVKKLCKNCGKEFITNKSQKVFCCYECYHTYNINRYTKKEMREIICKTCGKQFSTNHQYKKYCCIDCYKTAKKRRNLNS